MPHWCLHTAYSALRQHTPHHTTYLRTDKQPGERVMWLVVIVGGSHWSHLPPSHQVTPGRDLPLLSYGRSLSPVWPARKSSDLRPVLPSYHCYSLTLLLWRLTVFYPGWLQHSLSSSLVSAVTQDQPGRLITSVSIK